MSALAAANALAGACSGCARRGRVTYGTSVAVPPQKSRDCTALKVHRRMRHCNEHNSEARERGSAGGLRIVERGAGIQQGRHIGAGTVALTNALRLLRAHGYVSKAFRLAGSKRCFAFLQVRRRGNLNQVRRC